MVVSARELLASTRNDRLPSPSLYGDVQAYKELCDRVLARSWQILGMRGPQGMRPIRLTPGSLDESLILVEEDGAAPRAFSNLCTHRGHPILQGPQPIGRLRCRYHGRCFSKGGKALSAPGFDAKDGFPTERDHLPEVPLLALGPLLFACLEQEGADPRPLKELFSLLSWMPWERAQHAPEEDRDYDIRANWLLYCENYLEGLHIPFVHPGLRSALDLSSYQTAEFSWGSMQWSQASNESLPCLQPPKDSPTGDQPLAALYLFVFPTTMLNLYPWGLSLNRVEPLGPANTRVRFQSLVWDPALKEQGAGSGLDAVEQEDEEVIERIQRETKTRLYRGGNYAPEHERGVRHFHRMLQEALA